MKLIELTISDDPPLLEMANLFPNETGLDYPIWVGKVGGQHGPRVKVSNVRGKWMETDNFVLNVSEDPKVLTPKSCKLKKAEIELIKQWIKINYDDLMILWWMFERGALTVKDVDTGRVLNYDDVRYGLKKV